jgi:hypothetical protein
MLNEDYRDMLPALCDEKVKFLLVGAYALAAHGYPRATMDIDIWVMPSPQNAEWKGGLSCRTCLTGHKNNSYCKHADISQIRCARGFAQREGAGDRETEDISG